MRVRVFYREIVYLHERKSSTGRARYVGNESREYVLARGEGETDLRR